MVALLTVNVAAILLKVTDVAPVKLVPVMITVVPPVTGPLPGTMLVMVGADICLFCILYLFINEFTRQSTSTHFQHPISTPNFSLDCSYYLLYQLYEHDDAYSDAYSDAARRTRVDQTLLQSVAAHTIKVHR